MRSAIAMIFLLNRRYAPFYKWVYRALDGLPILGGLKVPLTELAAGPLDADVWTRGNPPLGAAQLNTRDPKVVLIEEISAQMIRALRAAGLSSGPSDFLQDHAAEIMAGISDERIRRMHVLEG